MADIVVCEFMDTAALAEGLAGFDVFYDPGLVDRPDELRASVAEARALIVRNRTQVRGALLEAAAKLEAVGRLGVGLDNIDMDACAARGITVYPATGANDVAVAEWVFGAMLMLRRRTFAATADVVAGTWPREKLMGRELAGATVGLVGFGGIAQAVAARAAAFGMNIVAFDPHVAAGDARWSQSYGHIERLELPDLLARADVISLHVPLTDGTRNLIDAAALARCRPDAIVINSARGGVVDEAAVVAALKANKLGGAALDVFASEPLKADSGKVFADCPNLLLTPHVAGVTVEANVRVSTVTAMSIAKHLRAKR